MEYPKFLQENGTIGLVAPSFGAGFEPYISTMNNAEERFQKLGFTVVEGPNARKGEGIGISSTPENCGTELTDYYCNDTCDVLISCGGGELMCETIDYVDFFDVMSAEPKWYMGYSDNTNFTFLLNTICDVASIYGPCVSSFGASEWHQSHFDAMDMLTGKKLSVKGYDSFETLSLKTAENPIVPLNLTDKKVLHPYIGTDPVEEIKPFEGRLLGGCLDCLVNLVGTKYDHVGAFNDKYGQDGIIWFLEACDLNIMSIRRALWHLDRAGWFDNAAGFIIGRPLMAYGQEEFGLSYLDAVTGVLGKYNVPIIQDADIGHFAPMMPLISGAMATVSVSNNNIEIEHKLV